MECDCQNATLVNKFKVDCNEQVQFYALSSFKPVQINIYSYSCILMHCRNLDMLTRGLIDI